ncbi:hypothetical protein LJ656_08390 [Paraburkholderia sp. MMS20-SJTR3]|uniref:Uncharacterized protein n=1 Tax=Paraburkholderia sejongensis TaxID=2886946 RepID=A0ABS8JS79_9BURK|nr:hypothetical protein [Paraburkholderia sp. MMS20-SJTR3]MCC8392604.1 hypothetical protein [Paraburkholderia sp. MMS20-SJTR3]
MVDGPAWRKIQRAGSIAWVLLLFLTVTISMWVFQSVGRLIVKLKRAPLKRADSLAEPPNS